MRVVAALFMSLVVVALTGCPVHEPPAPPAPPAPPTPPAPDNAPDLPPAVIPIAEVSEPDLAEFYAAFADVLERDTDIVKTTGQLRTAYMRAGQLAFQETGVRHPELAHKIDRIMADWIGLDDVPLTPEHRQKAVKCFRAIALALE